MNDTVDETTSKDRTPVPQPAEGGPVLSEDEVSALLSGVESGAIEVHSAEGPRYATVTAFEIPRRSRIATRSLPKLELLNGRFAERLSGRTQQVLDTEIDIRCISIRSLAFGDVVENDTAPGIAVEFGAAPLPGSGALTIDSELVSRLVELFFGGSGNEPRPASHDGFTPGIVRVVDAYARIVFEALKTTWASFHPIDPKPSRIESGINLLSIADEADAVVQAVFEFSFGDCDGALSMLLPEQMLASLMPRLRGETRRADPGIDQRWAAALREGLPGVSVRLSTRVGQATMSLRDLICLEPGDIIGIDSPTEATILANDVGLLRGRYGVHGGRNAVAATGWISYDDHTTREATHGK